MKVKKIRLSNLIETLVELKAYCDANVGVDPFVVVDLDEDGGYYNLEEVEFDHLEGTEPGDFVVNLKSSNEA